MRGSRRPESHSTADATQVERRADARRQRAMSHLERVRGQAPRRGARPPRLTRWGVAALVFGAVAGAIFAPSLRARLGGDAIGSIAVHGADRLTPAEVAAASGIPRGADLAELSRDEVLANLAAHDWIETARMLPLPDGALVLAVVERHPVARVAGGADESVHWADPSGTPFALADDDDEGALPLVRLPRPVEPQAPDATLARALQLASALVRSGLPGALEIGVSPDSDPTGFTLKLAGFAPRVILGWEKPEARLPELARIVAAARPEIAGASEIDLRFAGQAVLRDDPLPEGAEQAAEARGLAPPSEHAAAG